MKSFLRILKYTGHYWPSGVLAILFNVVAIAFAAISLTMIIPFLRLLFSQEKLIVEKPELELSVDTAVEYFNYTIGYFITEYGRMEALLFICGFVIVVFLMKNLFRYLAMFVMAHVRNGVVRDLRNDLYEKVLHLPVAYFSEQRKGDVMTRLTSDVQEVEVSIMSMLVVLIREPITILTFLAVMLYMSPMLTLFVLIMLPLTGLIIGRIGKTLKKTSAAGQHKLGELLSIVEETLTGQRIIKAFNAAPVQLAKFRRDNDIHFQLMRKMLRRRDLSSPLSEFLGITVVAGVLAFGGSLVLRDDINLEAEMFITFIVIFSQLIPPSKAFSTAFYNIQKGLASTERIERVLDTPVVIEDKPDASPLYEFKTDIRFQKVSFAYRPDTLVLKNINLTIPKGKMVALVGASGAGKSTLADLVPRFYDPTEGAVLLDDVDIRDYKLADLRRQMGIVTQQSILFNDTVFNNISFGLQNTRKEDVVRAAKIANAHRFIAKLPKGYYTNIGDAGDRLSGGEKQRIAIARAVLKNPPVLILDEATSSLDTESEKLVQDALLNLMRNRTSLVIAHRLSTIQDADKIAVMESGEIIEQGNHKALLRKEGTYKKLVEMQTFE